MGGEVSHQAGDYQEPEVPEGMLEVRISVYKLEITGVGVLDRWGAGLVGAYHTGVVVAKEEWAYGGHDVPGKSGVYRTKPELNPEYIFYRREVMGHIRGEKKTVEQQIRQLARTEKWSGPSYELIERNCNHFASELCWMLLKKRPPDWINLTAENMALSRRRQQTEQAALQAALIEYSREFGPAISPVSMMSFLSAPIDRKSRQEKQEEHMKMLLSAPGAKAFAEAFSSTFELAWRPAKGLVDDAGKRYLEGEDPEVARSEEEKRLLSAAVAASLLTARVVACAARTALEARAQQPEEGVALEAWDDAWARASGQLLSSWRQQALAGTLAVDLAGGQGEERMQRVIEALEQAAEAGQAAAEKDQRLAARRAELEKRVSERAAR